MFSPLLQRSLWLLAVMAALAPPAGAQTLAFSAPNGRDDNGGLQSFSGSLGLFFTVNAAQTLTISSVGYWDDNLDGLNATLHVAIFDRNDTVNPLSAVQFSGDDGTLVGNIVYPELNAGDPPGAAGSGQPGQFRMQNLASPLVLSPGSYAIVAWGYNGFNQFLNGVGAGPVVDVDTFGGALTFDGVAFGDASHPSDYPTNFGGTDAIYTAATFSPDAISAIPEPAGVACILAASALAFAVLARRRFVAD